MAIKLLGHVWRAATPGRAIEPRLRLNDWGVELREPSQWNPHPGATTSAEPHDARPPDSVWAETQPCCHD